MKATIPPSAIGVLVLYMLVGSISTAHGTAACQERPQRDRIDGQTMTARLKRRVQPVYPKDAAMKGVQGTVRLHAIVARDGSVAHLQVSSGPTELAQAAVDAVQQWEYEPIIRHGEAVEVETTIDVIFQLKKKN